MNMSLLRTNASAVNSVLMTSSASMDDADYVTHQSAATYEEGDMEASSYESVIQVQKVVIPLLCLLGLVFNVMAVRILVQRTLRRKSCCMYLTVKCITDTVFLCALFVVWLDRIQVPWFHRHGVCQIIIFTTYVCAFTSVWLVVMVTGENYIRICHPHRVHFLCTMGNARVCLVCLGLLSVFCYQFPLWTVHSVVMDNITRCALIPEYARFNNGLTYFDTAVTLIIPLLLVLAFMGAIFHQLWFSFRRNRRMKKLGRQRHTHFLCLSPYGRVTAMLLAVSFTFIVLHTPSHVIRLRILLTQAVSDGNDENNRNNNDKNEDEQFPASIGQLRLQRLFELLYYSSFSTNWVTYFSFGRQFRHLYTKTFCPCLIGARRPTSHAVTCTCSNRRGSGNRRTGKSGQQQVVVVQNGESSCQYQNYVCLSVVKRGRCRGGEGGDGDEEDEEEEEEEEEVEEVMVTEMVSTECVQLSCNRGIDTRLAKE